MDKNRSFVTADETSVFVRDLDKPYPLFVRGEGAWLYDASGHPYLDAVSGGAMVTSFGHGVVPSVMEAIQKQTEQVSFIYNVHATSPAQEQLARDIISIAPEGFTRVHFVTGGTEANELALRMVRNYHVERGESARHIVVSPAQSYHGASIATFGLTGRKGLQEPYGPYIQQQEHISPATWLFDTSGESALRELDAILERVGDQVAAQGLQARPCDPGDDGARDLVTNGNARTGQHPETDHVQADIDGRRSQEQPDPRERRVGAL